MNRGKNAGIAGAISLWVLSLVGSGVWAASQPTEPIDESINWDVENSADQDYSEDEGGRTLRSLEAPPEEFPSIHQIQQEEYDSLGLTSEEEVDRVLSRSVRAVAPKALAAAGGTLQKRVVGWHPYWMGTAYQRYDYSKLSTIAYFSAEVNPTNGNLTTLNSWSTTPVVAWAHSNSVKVVLTATLFGSANNAMLLTNSASCSNLINQLMTAVSNRGDGVNIDFESVGSSSKTYLTAFLSNLTTRFHRDIPGSEISIALPAVDWGSAYDAGAYDSFLDYGIIMGYDYHWRSSTDAGPVAPLSASATWGSTLNVTYSITNYLGKGLRASKLLLANPYYGYDWPTTSASVPGATSGTGSAVLYSSAKNNATTYGRQWNSAGSAPYYVYTNGSTVIHQCWYDDVTSLGLKYDLVLSKDIGGVGIWALGYDDTLTELWDLIGEKFTSTVEADWQSQSSGTSSSIYGVGAKGGAFAAVGASGLIRTSADGITWSAATNSTSELLLNVNGAGGNWVAVGDLGRILTSPDGATWTARTTPTNAMLRAVAYGGGVHVAGGANGVILRSTDRGTNWAAQTSGTTNTIQGIVYAGGNFVAVGTSGIILTSPDGAAWTARTSGTTVWLLDAAYGNGQIVAVGLSGVVLTSSDGGTNWVSQTSGTAEHLYRAAYGNGQFVAAGTVGTILGSANGTAWSAETSGTTNMLRGVVYSNNQFVAVGYSGTILTKGAADPTLAITTLGATVPNATSSQTIAGTANAYAVGTMRWTNSLGGSGTFAASTNWSFSASLAVGTNGITVTATNAAGRSAGASVTFVRQVAEGGGGSGAATTAAAQPAGGLDNIVIYASAGHGFAYSTNYAMWMTGRGLGNGVVEDIGNIDQLNYFADYCFKAGATVVPMRPLGQQTNEVVLDNTNGASVTFGGSWSDSSSTIFYGAAGATPYRYAAICATGTTAWAIYRPNLPAAGFYPVYAWTRSGSDRVRQLYRVYHSGGVTDVRVNHRRVGLGWVWLGTYYFDAGTNGSVNISNYAPDYDPDTDVVIADAMRFGNGMGSISRGAGVSGFARELEASRYWVQAMTGQGMSSTLYDSASLSDSDDNVGAPPRMAVEMNRSDDGGFFDRIYLGFHSNAGSGTGRGPMGLYDTRYGTAFQNLQKDYAYLMARELTNDLGYGQLGVWFPDSFTNNTANLYGSTYGEIYGAISNEMNTTIIEVGYHDNAYDSYLLKCPSARRVIAMSAYQAIVKHLTTNNAEVSPVLLPDPPTHVSAVNNGPGNITLKWHAPVTNRAGGHAATGYILYRSTNGYGFGNPVAVSGGATLSATLTNMTVGQTYYFQVCATNLGGESLGSKVVGVRVSPAGFAPHLVVNGFERNSRSLSPSNYVGGNIAGYPVRVIQRRINSQDYVVQHGAAIAAAGRYFDSCDNAAVLAGDVDLADYFAAYWILGRESVTDESFSPSEQTLVMNFLNPGKRLFVSGAEMAYDLIAAGTAADIAFCTNYLKTGYSSDDALTNQVTAKTGGVFDGLGTFAFDYAGTGTTYRALYPDVLATAGVPSSASALVYGTSGAGASIAGLSYSNVSRLVVMGFPFETIYADSARTGLLTRVISFFGEAPADTPVVDITTADQSVSSGTTNFTIAGTNNAAVTGTMTWSNRTTGASGTFAAAAAWSNPVTIASGVNTVLVSGVNYLLTQTAVDTVRVTVVGASYSSLGVTLGPAGAVAAGAQWSLDGAAWRSSGTTATGLVAGVYTASFSAVTGWTSPPPRVVQTTNGRTTSITATYTQLVGSLQVTISPAAAITAGATWRVDGGAWRDSGSLATNLSPGAHTVSFSAVSGWTAPSDQAATVMAGETAASGGLYTRDTGSLTVLIDPQSAVDAGAQWNVDNGAWRASGAIVADVATGIHTVRYSTVTGFTAPTNAATTVSNGLTSTLYGTYVPGTASATVTLLPAGAVSAGAQWRVDGGTWRASGATASGLALGAHTLSFQAAAGWSTPGDRSISLTNGQALSTSVTYAAQSTCPGADNAQQTDESAWTNRAVLVAGEAFDKTWTLKNTGSNAWTAADGYDLRLESGDSFGISSPVAMDAADEIRPGESKVWSVSGTAPATIGETRGVWMMHHNDSAFGDPVWIRIETEAPGGGAQ